MFFTSDVLQKRGRLFLPWIAATHNGGSLRKYLTPRKVSQADVGTIAGEILVIVNKSYPVNVPRPIETHTIGYYSLYLSSKLMFGCCVLLKKQAVLLFDDLHNVFKHLNELKWSEEKKAIVRHVSKEKRDGKDPGTTKTKIFDISSVTTLDETPEEKEQGEDLFFSHSVDANEITMTEDPAFVKVEEDMNFGDETLGGVLPLWIADLTFRRNDVTDNSIPFTDLEKSVLPTSSAQHTILEEMLPLSFSMAHDAVHRATSHTSTCQDGQVMIEDSVTGPGDIATSATLPAEIMPPEVLPAEIMPPATLPAEIMSPGTLPAEIIPPAILPAEITLPETLPAEIMPPATLPAEIIPPAILPAEITLPETMPGEITPPATLPAEVMSSGTLPADFVPVSPPQVGQPIIEDMELPALLTTPVTSKRKRASKLKIDRATKIPSDEFKENLEQSKTVNREKHFISSIEGLILSSTDFFMVSGRGKLVGKLEPLFSRHCVTCPAPDMDVDVQYDLPRHQVSRRELGLSTTVASEVLPDSLSLQRGESVTLTNFSQQRLQDSMAVDEHPLSIKEASPLMPPASKKQKLDDELDFEVESVNASELIPVEPPPPSRSPSERRRRSLEDEAEIDVSPSKKQKVVVETADSVFPTEPIPQPLHDEESVLAGTSLDQQDQQVQPEQAGHLTEVPQEIDMPVVPTESIPQPLHDEESVLAGTSLDQQDQQVQPEQVGHLTEVPQEIDMPVPISTDPSSPVAKEPSSQSSTRSQILPECTESQVKKTLEEMNVDSISVLDICPEGTRRLKAAALFLNLLALHKDRKIRLHQLRDKDLVSPVSIKKM